MALFVIAGKSDCPFYARIELLADKLALNLPNFRVTKIVKQPNEWKEFIKWIKETHGWLIEQSPVVWRELVNKGGKGILIGGANEFQELLAAYYGEQCSMPTEEILKIVEDNIRYKNEEDEDKRIEIANRLPSIGILIIGASTPATKEMLNIIMNEKKFTDGLIDLYLHDEVEHHVYLYHLQEMLIEGAFAKVNNIYVIDDIDECLSIVKQVIIMNVVPRICLNDTNTAREEDVWESRDQWLRRRFLYFNKLGRKIREKCQKSIRILIAGGYPGLGKVSLQTTTPICFDLTALYKIVSTKIPSSQIIGLIRPIELRVKATIAKHLKVRSCDVTDLVIWGNAGGTMFADLSRCCVSCRTEMGAGVVGGCFLRFPVLTVAENPKWLTTELLNVAFEEGSVKYGLVDGNAISDLLKEWWGVNQNQNGQITSLVKISNGDWYGVPKGIAFSYPIICTGNGNWSVVEDMPMTPESEAQLKTCIQSILEDWAVIDPAPLEAFLKQGKRPEDIMKYDDEFEAQDSDELLL
uniref:Malate dehydrogenase 1B n=1 Tax=Trichobilharzia regenti TaxID=157069 RepID=A0AA85ILR2_TRIRE|nr:unnamed protein product [Trichobilharzia regenti]